MKKSIDKNKLLTRGCILLALCLITLGAAFLFGDFNDGKGAFFSIGISILAVSLIFGLTNARVGFKLVFPLTVCLLSLAYTFITISWPVGSAWDLFYFSAYYGGTSIVSLGVGTVINLVVRAIAKIVKKKKQNKKANLS